LRKSTSLLTGPRSSNLITRPRREPTPILCFEIQFITDLNTFRLPTKQTRIAPAAHCISYFVRITLLDVSEVAQFLLVVVLLFFLECETPLRQTLHRNNFPLKGDETMKTSCACMEARSIFRETKCWPQILVPFPTAPNPRPKTMRKQAFSNHDG